MMTALWVASAVLLALLLWCAARLIAHRREALRLHEQIQAFLKGEVSAPPFSVKDSSLALFENAVIELEERLLLSEARAHEREARSRAFVQDVSHQFKTPIAGLRLYCEIDESVHRERQLQLIERMEALIGSMLKLEKLCSDGYAPAYDMCDLRALALEVRAQFAALYPQKRILVDGGAQLRCDAYWIAEALGNILKNACEHTDAGGLIKINIAQSDSEAWIHVEDDGGGVPADALPRLFERFYRSSGSEQGVGLGLAIAKAIVQKHHGSIRAENGASGLSIRIYLPVLHRDLKKT